MVLNAYETVILAGLLHDIGKFLQRGDYGSLSPRGRHSEISAQFVRAHRTFFDAAVDSSALAVLVEKHHESQATPDKLQPAAADSELRPLAYLVSRADNYSSSERGDSSHVRPDFKVTSLASVMSEMDIGATRAPIVSYPLAVLDPDKCFPAPVSRFAPTAMTAYIKRFGEEFSHLAVVPRSFPVLYSHLLSLLQRFTWCIPSSTMDEIHDVSLYDHLKTASAIAAALYRYHEDSGEWAEETIRDDAKEKFLLIVADFAGIQRYIFDIVSTGAGGVAKRLRARSFFVSAMIDGVAHLVLRRLVLPVSCVLMNSGGKFYLLAPNTRRARDEICALQRELEEYLLREYRGEIILNLGWTPLRGTDFGSFDRVLAEAAHSLDVAKNAPFHSVIEGDAGWIERSFVSEHRGEGESLCPSCRKAVTMGDLPCKQCERDARLGTVLPNARYLACFDQPTTGSFEVLPGYHVTVSREPPSMTAPELVVKLNDSDVGELSDVPATFRFVANYIPLFDERTCSACPGCTVRDEAAAGQPMFFDCLALASAGKRYLGYLKADVDNLGTLLVHGLRRDPGDERQPISVSRLATFSRMLEIFFSGYLDKLLRREFPLCYTVFSGGDDLFVIGPWDQAVKLADKVQRDFSRFVGENKNITLSAGVALAKARHPLANGVRLAEEELKRAKNQSYDERNRPKDQFAVFGEVAKWSHVPRLLESATRLAQWLSQGVASDAFARHLLYYGDLYRRYRKEGEIEGLRFLPLLSYDIGRNLPPADSMDPTKREYRNWAEGLRSPDSPELRHLRLIASYALTYTRNDKGGEGV